MPSTIGAARVANPIYKLSSTQLTAPPTGIAAGFTGNVGDLVYLNAGAVTQACATSATISSKEVAVLTSPVGTGTVAGSATGALAAIEKLDPLTLIELPFGSSASTGSVGTPKSATPTGANIGVQYLIARDSLGTYYVDVNQAGAGIEIVELSQRFPAGDAFVTVVGKMVPAATMA